MSRDMTGCGDLPQEQTEPSDHETEAHQSQAGPHPSKERPFCRETNPWVFGRLVVHGSKESSLAWWGKGLACRQNLHNPFRKPLNRGDRARLRDQIGTSI